MIAWRTPAAEAVAQASTMKEPAFGGTMPSGPSLSVDRSGAAELATTRAEDTPSGFESALLPTGGSKWPVFGKNGAIGRGTGS